MSDSDLQAFLNLLLSRYFLVQAIVKIRPLANKKETVADYQDHMDLISKLTSTD